MTLVCRRSMRGSTWAARAEAHRRGHVFCVRDSAVEAAMMAAHSSATANTTLDVIDRASGMDAMAADAAAAAAAAGGNHL